MIDSANFSILELEHYLLQGKIAEKKAGNITQLEVIKMLSKVTHP